MTLSLLIYWSLFSTIVVFFFFNDTATTEIYTLSLHDALPISQGRTDAALRLAHLQRLLVEPGAEAPSDPDRRLATRRERPRATQALQGQRCRRRPRLEGGLALRSWNRDLRGRPRRLQPGRRLRIHPPERAAHAHRREGAAKEETALTSRPPVGCSRRSEPVPIRTCW